MPALSPIKPMRQRGGDKKQGGKGKKGKGKANNLRVVHLEVAQYTTFTFSEHQVPDFDIASDSTAYN